MIAKALANPLIQLRSSSDSSVDGLNMFQRFLNSSGVSATFGKKSALTLSSFYNGIEIICNDFAKLPKAVYQKTADGKGRQEINHPLKYIINLRPNQYMTAFQFDKNMVRDAILKGNGYAIIQTNNMTGQPVAMQYVDQDCSMVKVFKSNGRLFYEIDGEMYSSDQIVHVPGFSFNGITGVGVVTHAARSLGTSISAEEYANDYYDGKGVGMGVLTTSKKMDPTAKTRYSKALSNMFATKAKWIVPVIDEAAKFEHLKITPQEAQFLLSSEHGINEVARWLNINPSKLKHNKDINNSISESLERQHVNDSILPWAIKFEQEYNTKCLTQNEIENDIYIKFNVRSLLTADMQAQADYWSKLIYAGVYTRNEIRAYIEKNPLDGLDEPLTPVNTELMKQIEIKVKESEKNLES